MDILADPCLQVKILFSDKNAYLELMASLKKMCSYMHNTC